MGKLELASVGNNDNQDTKGVTWVSFSDISSLLFQNLLPPPSQAQIL